MQPLTPDQQADIEARSTEFRAKYLNLVAEYQMDFRAYPQYVQGPNGAFTTLVQMVLADKKYLPVPSMNSDDVIKKG